MNIFLIPYTAWRHLAVALFVGGATTLAWWLVLTWILVVGPVVHGTFLYWSQSFEGLAFLVAIAGSAAGASLLAEGSLRRRELRWRLGWTVLAAVVAGGFTTLFFFLTRNLSAWLPTVTHAHLLEDPSIVTLRYTIATWSSAGVASGLGAWVARKGQRFVSRTFGVGVDITGRPRATLWSERFTTLFHHVGAGASGGLLAACIWHAFGHYPALGGDLYTGAALGSLVWGFTHGLLAWPIPDDLYAGWIRVLSAERYGLRVPIDHEDGSPAERFVGHFPRGLDLYAPAEHGVSELHTSFVVDQDHNYRVRGLTIMPTTLKRLGEAVRLDYDPMRPAPLESDLKMGDRILMGSGDAVSEVEFILLPKEEM
ncbi:MAG: hypothetical protein H6736_06120 [Alphaproteobacteria bacterium]|nr:hypothetical protein [Alphaproteobacteria bacterium]MCB9691376.1 hypothetical protein [Alphaproteobacteria bacterium]